MIHELKTWKNFFDAILDGRKPFDVRKNDRDFKVGDIIIFREWNTIKVDYTGRECKRRVTYILFGFGLMPDCVALGLEKIEEDGVDE